MKVEAGVSNDVHTNISPKAEAGLDIRTVVSLAQQVCCCRIKCSPINLLPLFTNKVTYYLKHFIQIIQEI